MAENPALRLSRILGGMLLLQGKLGHQVLGQLLLFNATDVEVAAANVAIAATSQHPNAILQAVVRVAAPAVALRALTQRQQDQLLKLEQRLSEEEAALGQREAAGREARGAGQQGLLSEVERARRQLTALRRRHPELSAEVLAEIGKLDARLQRVRAAVAEPRAGPSSPRSTQRQIRRTRSRPPKLGLVESSITRPVRGPGSSK